MKKPHQLRDRSDQASVTLNQTITVHTRALEEPATSSPPTNITVDPSREMRTALSRIESVFFGSQNANQSPIAMTILMCALANFDKLLPIMLSDYQYKRAEGLDINRLWRQKMKALSKTFKPFEP